MMFILLIGLFLISCSNIPRQINSTTIIKSESGVVQTKQIVFYNSIFYANKSQSTISQREEQLNKIILNFNCQNLLKDRNSVITLVSYNDFEYGDNNYKDAFSSYTNRKLQLSKLKEIKSFFVKNGVKESQIKQLRYQNAINDSKNRIDLIYQEQNNKNLINGYSYTKDNQPIISINHS